MCPQAGRGRWPVSNATLATNIGETEGLCLMLHWQQRWRRQKACVKCYTGNKRGGDRRPVSNATLAKKEETEGLGLMLHWQQT